MTDRLALYRAVYAERFGTDPEVLTEYQEAVLRHHGILTSHRCSFPNGSFIAAFAPEKSSLHGYSPPLVIVDEADALDGVTQP